MRPPALLSTALLLSLAMGAVAQGNNNNNNNNNNDNNDSSPSSNAPASNNNNGQTTKAGNTNSPAPSSAPSGKNNDNNSDSNKNSAPPLPGLSSPESKPSTPANSKTTKSTNPPTAVITPTGSADPTNSGNVPQLTSKPPPLPTNLPKLPGQEIPVVTVPPTANAPYMQTSKMPEGTVFIAVGSILGFMALSVLLWRGMVVWALHRSVKRAAMQQNFTDSKAVFNTPTAPIYKFSDHESTISLAGLGPKNRKSMRPGTSGGAPSNLFFSPTATTAGLNAPGNRGSSYLPAGYYAAGSAQPGNGTGMAHINSHGHGNSINLSNIAAQNQGYQRARSMGTTPPGSPGLGMGHHGASTSSVNLAVPPGDRRTPSTYLEDLFDGEGAPPMPPHHGGR